MIKLDHYFDQLVATGRGLLTGSAEADFTHLAFHDWDQKVGAWLDAQAPHSGLSAEWSSLGASNLMVGEYLQGTPLKWREFRETVQNRLAWLGKLARSTQRPLATQSPPLSPSNRVFVVHGRDEGRVQEVARTLEKLGLRPVILHEQPNKGRTIIEKFVDYSDVAFAVVLMTADDEGRLVGDADLSPRARQNVVLELGFFLGKLGRDRVAALYEAGVDVPSDYSGVVSLPLIRQGCGSLAVGASWPQSVFRST